MAIDFVVANLHKFCVGKKTKGRELTKKKGEETALVIESLETSGATGMQKGPVGEQRGKPRVNSNNPMLVSVGLKTKLRNSRKKFFKSDSRNY